MKQLELISTTGARLNAFVNAPADSAPKAVLQINHGMAEHGARYHRFMQALADAGYASIVHDHRGHGDTKAADAPLGTFAKRDGLDAAIADINFVNAEAKAMFQDVPVITFGHSMGGILGLAHAIRHSETLDGAVLWNFNVDGGFLVSVLRALLKAERMFKGSDVPSRLAQKLTFEDWNKKFAPNRTDFDWLSRDEAEVDKYVADPLCGFPVSVGQWLDVTNAVQECAADANLSRIRHDLPINLLGGQADPSSDYGKALVHLAKRLNKAGLADISCKTLPDTRHETLNEINRDAETADLVVWLDARFGEAS